jgi:hypothetical protein
MASELFVLTLIRADMPAAAPPASAFLSGTATALTLQLSPPARR